MPAEPPQPHSSTSLHTFLNAINMLIGMGLLALPRALSLVGWVPGAVLVCSACGAAYWTACLLARCLEHEDVEGKKPESYAGIGRAAFGEAGQRIVGGVVLSNLFLVAVTYVILCVDSLRELSPIWEGGRAHLAVAAVAVPLGCFGKLRWLSFVSITGIVSIAILVGALFGCGFLPLDAPPSPDGPTGSILHPSPTQLFADKWITHLPSSFGIFVMSAASHIVFPSLARDMRRPSLLPNAVSAAYLSVLLFYLSFSGAGYLMFGRWAMPEITANLAALPRYPKWIVKLCVGLFVANPLSKIGIVAEPPASDGDRPEASPDPRPAPPLPIPDTRIFLRTSLMLLVITVALLFPGFQRASVLLGSAFGSATAVVFLAHAT
ncbi:transmembrane amino acid transporter protein-domain-containing protein [Hyaloraphidium curvatum]|nr:transmembrane amino acid transporter protein-domain-containing protein [Hyaloraphidium curvatum]